MSRFHLAQLNIGVIKGPIDSPVMAEFVANLDRINALAEQSPGFVWRLMTDEGNATSVSPYDKPVDDTIVNMSVWEDVASLNHYVYKTAHVEILKRRKEWFERMQESHMVLWWIARGHVPTVAEAMERLEHLRRHGPSAHAFTFRPAFAAPDAAPDTAPGTAPGITPDAGSARAPFIGDACPSV